MPLSAANEPVMATPADRKSSEAHLGLLDLPVELSDAIFSLCPHSDLLRLMFVSKRCGLLVKPILYRHPRVPNAPTTYSISLSERQAQERRRITSFVTTVQSDRALAGRVQSLHAVVGYADDPFQHDLVDLLSLSPHLFAGLRKIAFSAPYEHGLPLQEVLAAIVALPVLASVELDVTYAEFDVEDGVPAIVLPGISQVKLEADRYEDGHAEQGLLENLCVVFPNAETLHLNLQGVRLSEKDKRALEGMPRLRNVTVLSRSRNHALWESMGSYLPPSVVKYRAELTDVDEAETELTLALPGVTIFRLPTLDADFVLELADALENKVSPSLQTLVFSLYATSPATGTPALPSAIYEVLEIGLKGVGFSKKAEDVDGHIRSERWQRESNVTRAT